MHTGSRFRLFAVPLCAALLLCGCGKKKAEPQEIHLPVETAEPSPDTAGQTAPAEIPDGGSFYTEQGNLVIVDDSGFVPEPEDEPESDIEIIVVEDEDSRPADSGNITIIVDDENSPAVGPSEPQPVGPSEPQQPAGTVLGSGSFSSSTGTSLNLIADWTAAAQRSGTALITVNVSITSGSLQTGAVPGSISVSVGNNSASLNAPAVSYSGSGMISTACGSCSFTVPLSGGGFTGPLNVSWRFGGTYSGVSLNTVSCGGTVSFHG